jgi:hypothetical protein
MSLPLVLLSGSSPLLHDPADLGRHAAVVEPSGHVSTGVESARDPVAVRRAGRSPAAVSPAAPVPAAPAAPAAPVPTPTATPSAPSAPPSATHPPVREHGSHHAHPPAPAPPPVLDPPATSPPTTLPLGVDAAIGSIDVGQVTLVDQSAAQVQAGLTGLRHGSTLVVDVTSGLRIPALTISPDWTCRQSSVAADGTSPGHLRLSCTYDGADADAGVFRFVVLTSGASSLTATIGTPRGVIDPDLSNNTATAIIAS